MSWKSEDRNYPTPRRGLIHCAHFVKPASILHNGRQTRDKCAHESACKMATAVCYMSDLLKHDKIVSCEGSVKMRSNTVPQEVARLMVSQPWVRGALKAKG